MFSPRCGFYGLSSLEREMIRCENQQRNRAFLNVPVSASDPEATRLSVVTCKRVINPPRKGLARPWRTKERKTDV